HVSFVMVGRTLPSSTRIRITLRPTRRSSCAHISEGRYARDALICGAEYAISLAHARTARHTVPLCPIGSCRASSGHHDTLHVPAAAMQAPSVHLAFPSLTTRC